MPFFIVTLILLSFSGVERSNASGSEAMPERILFNFDRVGEAPWQVVNDGVMGGRSTGYTAVDGGHLRFWGTLVTRGGGFTSIRTNARVDMTGYDGLELRVRGNGRTFEVEVSDGTRYRGRSVSRRASFKTDSNWTVVRVPFNTFKTTIFGQTVRAEPIDLSQVRQMGFYIVDGIDGTFMLDVDSIGVYRLDGDS